ncbi:hypothetical protein Bbelb_302320 [Branchiostoma belcheri]|nr:hypothetical protein Bbelb_302320 [Branchiostoma belcheri]
MYEQAEPVRSPFSGPDSPQPSGPLPQPRPVRQSGSRGRARHSNGASDKQREDQDTSSHTYENAEEAKRYATSAANVPAPVGTWCDGILSFIKASFTTRRHDPRPLDQEVVISDRQGYTSPRTLLLSSPSPAGSAPWPRPGYPLGPLAHALDKWMSEQQKEHDYNPVPGPKPVARRGWHLLRSPRTGDYQIWGDGSGRNFERIKIVVSPQTGVLGKNLRRERSPNIAGESSRSIKDGVCYTCAKTSQPFPPPTANGNLLSLVVLPDVSPANTQRGRQPRLPTPYICTPRLADSVRRWYSPRTDALRLPTFLHVDSTQKHVRRVVTEDGAYPDGASGCRGVCSFLRARRSWLAAGIAVLLSLCAVGLAPLTFSNKQDVITHCYPLERRSAIAHVLLAMDYSASRGLGFEGGEDRAIHLQSVDSYLDKFWAVCSQTGTCMKYKAEANCPPPPMIATHMGLRKNRSSPTGGKTYPV